MVAMDVADRFQDRAGFVNRRMPTWRRTVSRSTPWPSQSVECLALAPASVGPITTASLGPRRRRVRVVVDRFGPTTFVVHVGNTRAERSSRRCWPKTTWTCQSSNRLHRPGSNSDPPCPAEWSARVSMALACIQCESTSRCAAMHPSPSRHGPFADASWRVRLVVSAERCVGVHWPL